MNLDAKGRLAVPARHRDVLYAEAQGRLTLTKHPQGCLLVFPRPEWEKFREQIQDWPMEALRWKRMFLGNAMDVEMDASHRILISPELRAVASIDTEVLLLGMGRHFELWDKTAYEEDVAKTLQEEMPAVVGKFVF